MSERGVNDEAGNMQATPSNYKMHECDTLRNTLQAKPILLSNEYGELQDDSDEIHRDVIDNDSSSGIQNKKAANVVRQKENPNKRQRKMRRMQLAAITNDRHDQDKGHT